MALSYEETAFAACSCPAVSCDDDKSSMLSFESSGIDEFYSVHDTTENATRQTLQSLLVPMLSSLGNVSPEWVSYYEIYHEVVILNDADTGSKKPWKRLL